MIAPSHAPLDAIDRRIIAALDANPRATTQFLAQELGLARGTVHAHLGRLQERGAIAPPSTRLRGGPLGRPLRVMMLVEVDQHRFDGLLDELRGIPEVVECLGISGVNDLHIEVVAVDADDVYRISQRIMQCPGIRRTASSIVLRELLPRRMHQLL